jgi:hypothetical protein
MPNKNLHMLEQIFEVMCASKILYGAEISGIGKWWEIVEGIQGKFCRKC